MFVIHNKKQGWIDLHPCKEDIVLSIPSLQKKERDSCGTGNIASKKSPDLFLNAVN
jgi:hypothetical protein